MEKTFFHPGYFNSITCNNIVTDFFPTGVLYGGALLFSPYFELFSPLSSIKNSKFALRASEKEV